MQGQRSSVTTLSENISFEHGSESGDAGPEAQISWNSMQSLGQSRLPEYRMPSSNETNIPYLQHVMREGRNPDWSVGESSSGAARHLGGQNERKPEHTWAFRSRGALTFEEPQYEPSSILSLDNVDINTNGNHSTNGSFVLQSSGSDVLPHDLNVSSDIGDQDRPAAYLSVGPSSSHLRPTGSSSGPFNGASVSLNSENEGRSDCSLDGRRMSCKRKALEGHIGQSSGAGSSNSIHNQWHTLPAAQISGSNLSMPIPVGDNIIMNNMSEQANPRLRLGVGGGVSASPFSLTPSSGSPVNQRNFRLRINGLHQQDPIPENPSSTDNNGNANADAPSSRHSSRLALNNRLFELNPPPPMENVNLHGQSVLLPVAPLRRSNQSRWTTMSTMRASSSSVPAISEHYLDPTARNAPRNISEHPLFIPASETGSSSQNPTNWSLPGGNNSIAGNIESTSQVGGTIAGAGSSAPNWAHRNSQRRISEFVRRSLLSSAGAGPGGHRSHRAVQASGAASHEAAAAALPPGPDYHRHRASSSRAAALLGRHHDGALGVPYSLRALAAANEGRGGIMSEICHVLDLMRRGEGLRLEDVMILDHPAFFGMAADMHDRHRDMRMDVDNMSYEELLALEERIGNVCTGLTEETIMSHLKQQKYLNSRRPDPQIETEPCSICREEYNNGENVGVLNCGHDFHTECIKQWLMHKNLCPICKATGLTTP
ncbi:probable E3 ubiquitin-protein ligase RHG1A isoform X2 [Andrographis paniculata]|uniref:probable E3 ubiquitin-protein ligase RHG1A isoform X2 n=1 Tax=Andrographis paniculata TaxID=175694 RepID=UPI0021E8231B|nr:probable E3 ubiquitin-protein ligase RHG1A isoform X2 [Andrographis paniculata]